MSTHPPTDAHRVSSDASADERTLYDPNSDDEGYDGRPSGELSDRDHDILESEDERERLLTQKEGMFGKKSVRIGSLSQKAARKAEMKERKRGGNEESSALMYEMEEGIGHSRESLSERGSEESDEQRLLAIRAQRKVGPLTFPCVLGDC